MLGERSKILFDSIKRLLRRQATSHLRNIVNKTHAADLSIVFRSLPIYDQYKLFEMIDDIEKKGILFSELDEDSFLALTERLQLDDIVEVLEHMPDDDVADLIGRLPEEKSKVILDKMEKEGSEEVEGLLRYGDDTAGGIMVPDFIALREDTTAKEAIESRIPLGRMGRPDEFGGICAFLLSPVASYIHGALLLIDGGLYRGMM